MRVLSIYVGLALLVSTVSYAASGDKSSGCGPGWNVTDKMSFSATTTRGTTNSYVTPFAMTSGTSGCAKHTIADNNGSYEFIASHRDQIILEASQGQGEYLTALATNLGCKQSNQLGSYFKQNFDEIFIQNNSNEAIFTSAHNFCAVM